MKKFTFLFFAVFALLLSSMAVRAQHQHTERCNTMEWYEEQFRTNPAFKAQFEANQARLAQLGRDRANLRTTAINDTVPVVIHVIGSATIQGQVTDAILQSQIDVLNEDFQGKNADSTRIPAAFKPLFGKMGLVFMLAKTDPSGLLTNGIERRTNAVTFTAGTADNAKQTALGGLDAWDPNKYMNLWVVSFGTTGLLGISVFPGDPRPLNLHGFVCEYRAFGRGAGYLFSAFNTGRTTTHELGHFWNLRHIWGDDGGACTGSDFPGAPIGQDDTPNQANSTFGNPDGPGTGTVVTDACSPSAPGIMYQNYMDYCDDIALVMFTKGQNARMETALTTAPDRSPILTSLTYQPPGAAPAVDARISAISAPANGSTLACNPVVPVVTIQNMGTNTLTSAIINVRTSAGLVGSQAWTGSLATGATASVTLNTVPYNALAGSNTLKIHTTQPNGVADNNAANDTASTTFTRTAGVALPVTQNFESTTFPPTGWSNVAVTGTSTWQRATVGVGAGSTGGSIKADFWNIGSGNSFAMVSPYINVSGLSILRIAFDVSHRRFSTSNDRLRVEVSADCGATWTTVYDKNSATGLVTVTTGSGAFTPAAAADWRNESVQVTGTPLSTGVVLVRFLATSAFGNNIYVDNINIDKLYARDLQVTTINNPGNFECGLFSPSVTVRNAGVETVTSYDVRYTIDGGSPQTLNVTTALAPGASVVHTFPALAAAPAAGAHTFSATTLNPVSGSGSGEENTANDALSKSFTQRTVVTPPIAEGFETNGSFLSPGWSLLNPGANNTWVKQAPGFNSSNSAFIDYYNFNLTGDLDHIQSPAFSLRGTGGVLADSVLVTWNLAHQNFPGANDSLRVAVSSDCGNSFSTFIFRRGGAGLAGPAGSNTGDYTVPLPAHWQSLRASVGGAALANGHMIAQFQGYNNFGNNVFLDNINISPVFKRDLKVISVNKPNGLECSGNFTPSVTVQNLGLETVTGFKVSYSIDNGTAQTSTFTGVSLARNATTTVNLNAASGVSTANHNIKVYSWDPVTASGTGDQLTGNDTLVKGFGVAGATNAPLNEGFESSTFAPSGWVFTNADNNITWNKATTGSNSTGSAFVNTFNYSALGEVDELVTPVISFTDADSVKLSFDLSAVTYSYPGSTGIPMDTLEILVTKDCGATFTTIHKLWGEELQTVNNPNYPQGTEFIPLGNDQWRRKVIELTQYAGTGTLQFVFRVKNNFENNIFIDNVNLTTRTLPQRLENQGYLILPNPFQTSFTIWHLNPPTDMKYVNVFNSAGQLVWTKQFNGTGDKQVEVSLNSLASGVYIVEVGYNDPNKNTQTRVVKQ